MKTSVKLAAYVAGLGVVFAAAAGVGVLAGPATAGARGHEGTAMTTTHGSAAVGDHGTGGHQRAPEFPKGLQVSQDGYTFAPQTTSLGEAGGTYAFRIVGPDGRAVTRYTRSHDKGLHLIAVRRDLAGFVHVHPVMSADGTWSIPLRLGAGAGTYRVFADFTPAEHDGGLTLGTDLHVPGAYSPRPVPPSVRTATVDGYTVSLAGDLKPATSSKLTFSVSHDGQPVADLQPYLGAYGHLVALRAGDLAYLHVHPNGAPGDGTTRPGPAITFYAEVPSAGEYRLYLDFQHNGVVRTAEFTAAATGTGPGHEPVPGTAAVDHGGTHHGG